MLQIIQDLDDLSVTKNRPPHNSKDRPNMRQPWSRYEKAHADAAVSPDPLDDACRRGRSFIHEGEATITVEEMEFGRAMDAYKRTYQRPFPTWLEVLAVLKSLGYEKGVSQGLPA